jgi:hypothetical protein
MSNLENIALHPSTEGRRFSLSIISKKDEKWLSLDPSFLIMILMRKPSFEEFEATSLYCPRCKAAVPVRKRLLLVLPEGDEYEYLCAYCSFSVGMKTEKNAPKIELILKP